MVTISCARKKGASHPKKGALGCPPRATRAPRRAHRLDTAARSPTCRVGAAWLDKTIGRVNPFFFFRLARGRRWLSGSPAALSGTATALPRSASPQRSPLCPPRAPLRARSLPRTTLVRECAAFQGRIRLLVERRAGTGGTHGDGRNAALRCPRGRRQGITRLRRGRGRCRRRRRGCWRRRQCRGLPRLRRLRWRWGRVRGRGQWVDGGPAISMRL